MNDSTPPDTRELRRRLRRLRAAIPEAELRAASAAVSARVATLPAFRRARRIAAYVGSKGEIDPMPLLYLAWLSGKQCFLPVLHPFLPGRLWFLPWRPGMPMVVNRFGIPEPPCNASRQCKPQWLDLVLMPLLGFDDRCHRLGMGGGFYDRTFAFVHRQHFHSRPALIALAHDVQRCDAIPLMPWDVRPSMIVTPTTLLACKARERILHAVKH